MITPEPQHIVVGFLNFPGLYKCPPQHIVVGANFTQTGHHPMVAKCPQKMHRP